MHKEFPKQERQKASVRLADGQMVVLSSDEEEIDLRLAAPSTHLSR